MKENIELARVRDFGELISDTILFMKQNLKPLLKSLIYIAGFFILASTALAIYNQVQVYGANSDTFPPRRSYNTLTFIGLIPSLLSYVTVGLTTYCYMSLYREKGNQPPGTDEVWSYVKYFFWRYLGASLLLGILVIIGFVLCIAPGVYLMPVVSIMMGTIVFENGTLSFVFDRGFKLIKNEWWTVFGALFVVGLILYVVVIALVVPVSVLSGASMFLSKTVKPLPVLIATTVLSHLAYFLMSISYVLIGVAYFSLLEKKEGVNLLSRVENIGKDNHTGLPEEEY